MSVQVDYIYYDNVFQDHEVWEWSWGLAPQDGRYWSATIIPEYANVAVCQITSFWWSTDNNEFLTANFIVQVDYATHPGGVNLGFKAIRAPSV
jgi:hypothetical protein